MQTVTVYRAYWKVGNRMRSEWHPTAAAAWQRVLATPTNGGEAGVKTEKITATKAGLLAWLNENCVNN